MVAALPRAVVRREAAVTSVALAIPAMAKGSAMRARAQTGATSVVAPTVAVMLTAGSAMVEAAATMAVALEAPAIQAMTATWVVPVRAQMEATSAVALKAAVTLVTMETMAATMVAKTVVERVEQSEKL